jgi:hypothetical protein
MAQGSKVVRDGVEIVQGTPAQPVTGATLFLRVWRAPRPAAPDRTLASLYMVRPQRGDYVIKELIPEMEATPQAAIDKAVAIAKRGDVNVVYLNADLAKLPRPRSAAAG